MCGDIHEVLCHIITLHVACDAGNILSPAVLHDIGYFTEYVTFSLDEGRD
jgi:hypothetical protein